MHHCIEVAITGLPSARPSRKRRIAAQCNRAHGFTIGTKRIQLAFADDEVLLQILAPQETVDMALD